MATLFQFIVGSLALHRRSFNQIDLFGRQKEVRQWMGTSRYMVASDATFWRVMPGMNPAEVREILQQAWWLLRRQGHGKIALPQGRVLRAAAVDGSALGGRYAAVLEILGTHAAVIDLEPCENRGKELPSAERLLVRAAERHGQGFVDILLGDGLYITQPMLNLCRDRLGIHLLVKTTEKDLVIIQNAEGIFSSPAPGRPVEHIKDLDLPRGVAYEIHAVEGLRHADSPHPLKVARVRLDRLKGKNRGSQETFWIVTTDQTLTARQMRELAHRRWSIENEGFRALSAAVDSKHVWTRGKNAAAIFPILMLLMFLAFTLTLAFHAHLDAKVLWETFRLKRATLGHLVNCFLLSLPGAAGAFGPSG